MARNLTGVYDVNGNLLFYIDKESNQKVSFANSSSEDNVVDYAVVGSNNGVYDFSSIKMNNLVGPVYLPSICILYCYIIT